ncbi:hypothetical protein N9L24_04370, partial [Candidatus Marinamargulisbacteria bacterium]|nr:hypothetical protein [Candidatus Marinamargulisbacteria bacterium]
AVDAGSVRAIREALGIPKLIKCLDSDNIGLKQNAAGALFRLAVDAGSVRAIRDAGGIPELIKCLDSDGAEVQQNAAGALCRLAVDANNKQQIKGYLNGSGHKLKSTWFSWGKFNIIIKKDSNNRV